MSAVTARTVQSRHSWSTELVHWNSAQAFVRTAQRLRYKVFAEELGARLHSPISGVDQDHFDEHCHHLLVRDNYNGDIVGYTRILDRAAAAQTGGFYSQTEFDIAPLLRLPGALAEIGRTCIHPAYRNGSTIAVLWSGIADFIAEHQISFLFGCASLPLEQPFAYSAAHASAQILQKRFGAPVEWQVRPLLPLPQAQINETSRPVQLPPLLKAYLRLGAKICGPPCLDPDFQAADFCVVLPTNGLDYRYARHFLT